MKKIKLSSLINESQLGDRTGRAPESGEHGDSQKFSTEVKKNFLEIVSTYNKYQEMMDRKSDIAKVAETLGAITEAACQLAVNEGDDWFDKHTVKRNMGELKKLGSQFDKVAKEAQSLDQRLNGLYEDMGHILSRYYKIGEITEDEMKSRLGMNESINEGIDDISDDEEIGVLISKLLKTPFDRLTTIDSSNVTMGNDEYKKIKNIPDKFSEGRYGKIEYGTLGGVPVVYISNKGGTGNGVHLDKKNLSKLSIRD